MIKNILLHPETLKQRKENKTWKSLEHRASALRISQTASAKKELKRQETANMKALDQTLSKLKGDVLKQILPAIETLGYRGFVEKTGVSFSTVSELKNNGTSMKLERLLEIQQKIKNNR